MVLQCNAGEKVAASFYQEASITKVVGAFFVTQISQMTQIFSLLLFFVAFPFFPQILQMCTDFRPVRSG